MNKIKEKILPIINKIDEKFKVLLPDVKLRKITYIAAVSIFSLIFLIIILGTIFSASRSESNQMSSNINKRNNIPAVKPEPQKEQTETQKRIFSLEQKVKNLKFPESGLAIPIIESNIKI